MLANMPTTTGIGNINPHPNMEHGQCIQYNFLKRKLNVEDTQQSQQQQQEQINNSNGAYQGSTNIDGNAWKKRHTEELALTTATTTTTKTSTCFDTNSLNVDFISINGHKNNSINNNNDNMLSNNNNNNNNLTIHNSNNNNDLQFSLSSSAFINDLFSYDNNLIVPVSISNTIDVNATVAAPTIAVTSVGNIAPQYVTTDEANWQATDLLELDHRYNSTLQTVENVAQQSSSPTTTISTTATSPTIHQLNPTLPPQQHQQQAQQHFLIPQKQIARSQHMLTKYRQHYQQQHSQQQQQHPHPHPQQQQHTQQQQLQPQQEQYSNSQTQQQQSSDSESDFEDKNLSWLLNFKFDELPHLSPDIGTAASRQNPVAASESVVATSTSQQRGIKGNGNSPASSSSQTSSSSSERSRSKSPKTSSKASKKFEELVMEVTAECEGNDMIIGENVVVEDYSPKAQKKPPFTYTELIEYALEDKGELTVSGIYQWISDRFPFYKSNDDRWKNSVRHNLSINPHFRKGAKAPQGAGHLWTISSGDSAENVLAWEHKKQRLDLFFKMESMNRERIQEHQQKIQKQQHQQQQQQQLQQHQLLSHNPQQEQQQCSTFSPLHQQCQAGQCLYDEAAAAAAAITQEMLQQSSTSSSSPNTSLSLTNSIDNNVRELRHGFNELHGFNDLMSDEELRKTAGQILNGIHREVEVQSVNSIISTYHDVLLDTDYLNPIHKDVAVNESGLRNTCHNHTSSQYYITEIDPIELGIQMSHQVEEEVLFSDEFNLNYFGYNAGNDIVA